MIEALEKMETPNWLLEIAQEPNQFHKLPLKEILTDSLYYPACGLNGTPVKFLGGNIVSFIYADYLTKEFAFKRNLLGSKPESGFKGFKCIMHRSVTTDEIVPAGWHPKMMPTDPRQVERLLRAQKNSKPFGHWSIWQKEDPDADGAELFSFFYLAGEMNAIYQGLYHRLNIVPKILAIIQPGAIGGEWECVPNDKAFFHKVVKKHPSGMPPYLIYGGYGSGSFYKEPCWSEYKGEKKISMLPERQARLWKYHPIPKEKPE